VIKIPLTLAPDKLRISIISALKAQKKITGKERGVLDIKAGNRTGEIVYVANEMNISCMVSEDDVSLYFVWQNGKIQRVLKEKLLKNPSELSQ